MEPVLYRPNLRHIKKDGIVVLIDADKPNWAAVNQEGANIIEMCNGSTTSDQIAQELGSLYDHANIKQFISEALECGVISTTPTDDQSSYKGKKEGLKFEDIEELWVYVTRRCNLRCRHCLVNGGENDESELSHEEIEEILRSAEALGVKRVFFTGGEPFIRQDIHELIKQVIERFGMELVILSNGTLLNEETIKSLAEYKGLTMQISLESHDAGPNDNIRGNGTHNTALESLKMLCTYGIKTIVTSTATAFNIHSISPLNSMLTDVGVKTHHILWVHERGRALKNRIAADPDELRELMLTLKNASTKVDNWTSYKSRIYGGRGVKVDGCHAGYTSISVDSNGDIYPCPSLTGDKDFRMGNIEDGIEDVWRHSKVSNDMGSVSVVDINGCDACEFRFICGGGCRCQSYYSDGKKNLRAKDPYCTVIKAMIMESIMSSITMNGQGRPEFLGAMKHESLCSSRSVSVAPFHCTCVLDVEPQAHEATRKRYASAADVPESELCCPTGYTGEDLEMLPSDTVSISYGCGNPAAFAGLSEGESVLDIGSGGGIDCFIAAKKVGKKGHVIGVDMTDEMLVKAKNNKAKMAEMLGFDVVEFRKGMAEELPVESESIDLVISNCVINLAPDKRMVFNEIYRVLKRGGRFSISDIVSDRDVPDEMKQDEELWSSCISGALPREEFLDIINGAGFEDVAIDKSYKWKEVNGIGFHSITVKAKKQ